MLDLRVEWQRKHNHFHELRFLFRAEAHTDVPCHLLFPKSGSAPYPIIICLQGHSSGMRISRGRAQNEADVKTIESDRDFAPQIVSESDVALVMEQRCFGERST
ncbi:MAG: hypothetical protein JWN98_1576 [Abditibacteriota bacterium]|nr:hypothetical protein [Abditibacteriota bacterium]